MTVSVASPGPQAVIVALAVAALVAVIASGAVSYTHLDVYKRQTSTTTPTTSSSPVAGSAPLRSPDRGPSSPAMPCQQASRRFRPGRRPLPCYLQWLVRHRHRKRR